MQQVWFITGAARGIGAHVARAALAAGHRVVATGRDLARLHAAYADVGGDIDGGDLALFALDVTCPDRIDAAVGAALARFGRIDVLVNNAGFGQLGHFEEIGFGAIERQFATNVFGPMRVLRAVLPAMRRRRAGHVMNVSSIGGLVGFAGAAVYCASKFAVEGLSASLAPELAPFGIRVTAVEPGFFRTDFLDASSVRYGDAAIADYAGAGQALDAYHAYNHRQPGDPARLGKALVELAALADPPRQFLAGSDALGIAGDDLAARRASIDACAALSRSTDGAF